MSGYWNSVQRLIRDGITTKEIEKLRKKLFRKELLEEREGIRGQILRAITSVGLTTAAIIAYQNDELGMIPEEELKRYIDMVLKDGRGNNSTIEVKIALFIAQMPLVRYKIEEVQSLYNSFVNSWALPY